jgi:hypothetical protein
MHDRFGAYGIVFRLRGRCRIILGRNSRFLQYPFIDRHCTVRGCGSAKEERYTCGPPGGQGCKLVVTALHQLEILLCEYCKSVALLDLLRDGKQRCMACGVVDQGMMLVVADTGLVGAAKAVVPGFRRG